jgi:hypothetical protein
MTYRGERVWVLAHVLPWRLTAQVALLTAVLAGCSSGIIDSGPSSAGSSPFRDRMASLFYGASADATPQPLSGAADPNWDCPIVDIRTGASTLQTHAGRDASSGLRYQASIARVARECAVAGPTMTVKVGVQGRIILGQAGCPGQMEIPLRYALVREGPQPRTIVTKLHRFPVVIAEGQQNTPFLHVEEDISFTVPPRGDLENYVVYVGFDPAAPKEAPVKKRPSR